MSRNHISDSDDEIDVSKSIKKKKRLEDNVANELNDINRPSCSRMLQPRVNRLHHFQSYDATERYVYSFLVFWSLCIKIYVNSCIY